MTARTHDMFAFAFLVTAATYSPPQSITVSTLFICIVGNIVGALMPDMDQASNRLWDLFPAGNYVGKVFRRLFLGHRTISHSLLGGFLLFKLLEGVLPKVFNTNQVDVNLVLASVMIGFISHLVADALTKEGIPLLFPLPFKIGFPPFRILRVTTDSWVESYLVLPSVAIYILWFISIERETLVSILRSVAA